METTEGASHGSRQSKGFALSFGEKITTQYVIALSLIAILVIIGYVVLLELMSSHASWAAAINQSGRQRMISQRISKLAHDLVMRTHDNGQALRKEMEEWARHMEKSHQIIINGDKATGLRVTLSGASQEIIYYPPHELDKKISRYIEAVRKFAGTPDDQVSPENREFQIIEEYSQKPLLDSLDALVTQFQSEAEENAVAFRRRVTAITVILLFTILVVGVVIFRPLASQIQRSASELADSERKLSGITSSLGEGVIVADKMGVITFANPMSQSITGFKESDLLGMSVMDMKMFSLEGAALDKEEIVLIQALHSSPLGSLAETVEPISVRTREVIIERKGGDRLIVEMNVSRLLEKGNVVGVVASIKDITMRKTMERIVAAKSALVQLLQEIAFAVSDVDTVDEAMSVCMSKVCQHTIWDVGHVYKPDNEDILHPTELWYTKDQTKFAEFREITSNSRFVPGKGLPGRVFLSKKPAWIKDVQKDKNFPRAMESANLEVRAGFAFPVLEGEKVVAVLEFFSTKVMDPDESIMDMAKYLSTQLGRVTERKRDMEIITESRDMAEAATRLKDKFISLVAHDMRTPLSTILGLIKSLKTDIPDPLSPMQLDIISKVIISGENMIDMIDNLLDMERLQSGMLKVEKMNLDTRALAEEVVESLSYEAAAKNIKLQNDVKRGVKMLADYELIVEVIKNIVHNSIKFCSDGDTVTFHSPSDSDAVLAISDTGPGVRKEVIANLFKHEIKTSTMGTAGERGTGLGLPLCHDIMKAHDGSISVTSELGKGATFFLRLPKKEEMEPAAT